MSNWNGCFEHIFYSAKQIWRRFQCVCVYVCVFGLLLSLFFIIQTLETILCLLRFLWHGRESRYGMEYKNQIESIPP